MFRFPGYAIYPDRVGDFVANRCPIARRRNVAKPCALNFDPAISEIPSRVLYIASMFMPRENPIGPLTVPPNSSNFACQSVRRNPDDVVFTVEHSIRAVQMPVYELLKIKRPVPVTIHRDK